MKNLISFLFFVAYVLSGMAAEPIYRNPRVIPSFVELVQRIWVDGHFNLIEGAWSSTMSSIQRESDYFVVLSKNWDGARILKMDPIKTGPNGIIEAPNFTDIVSKKSYSLEYKTVGTPAGEEYYHYGVLNIGEDKYNVAVAYGDSLAHPAVLMTWGTGSDIFDVGVIADSFEEMVTADKAVSDSISIVRYTSESFPESNGNYLAVSTPKEYGQFKIRSSTDMINWSEYTAPPFGISGEIVIYKLPDTGSGFFTIE